MTVYPSNSGKEPEVKEQMPVKRKPVASGKPVKKKKTVFTKFADIFLPEDRDSMREYIRDDVIVPYLKRIADDAFHMFLYGRGGAPKESKSSGLFYSSIYESDNRTVNSNAKALYHKTNPNLVAFDTLKDAESVLMSLMKDIKDYGFVTVLSFCEYAKYPSQSTDDNYGWVDLTNVKITSAPDGSGRYVINLPKPIPID